MLNLLMMSCKFKQLQYKQKYRQYVQYKENMRQLKRRIESKNAIIQQLTKEKKKLRKLVGTVVKCVKVDNQNEEEKQDGSDDDNMDMDIDIGSEMENEGSDNYDIETDSSQSKELESEDETNQSKKVNKEESNLRKQPKFIVTLPQLLLLFKRNEAGSSPAMEYISFQRCMDYMLNCKYFYHGDRLPQFNTEAHA
ncbi:uncharacterized protein LOC124448492 [Xenia sp. Carnegie-2017]|uniref:uncharacterized protein LOC124448492 n=1 Tax=Xenia sp. Carnegie-2017 TaxID=2897299 RepID=UPI001F04A64C|nr:uncharacterized protein LOC124448492 [Xenia sp. Carnegie-2017]